MFMNRY